MFKITKPFFLIIIEITFLVAQFSHVMNFTTLLCNFLGFFDGSNLSEKKKHNDNIILQERYGQRSRIFFLYQGTTVKPNVQSTIEHVTKNVYAVKLMFGKRQVLLIHGGNNNM